MFSVNRNQMMFSLLGSSSPAPVCVCVCVCFCREGRGPRSAGQRAAGRQRALRRPGGHGEASRVQSADWRESALLQLRHHAEACPGQCVCVCVCVCVRWIHLYRLLDYDRNTDHYCVCVCVCRTMRSTCWVKWLTCRLFWRIWPTWQLSPINSHQPASRYLPLPPPLPLPLPLSDVSSSATLRPHVAHLTPWLLKTTFSETRLQWDRITPRLFSNGDWLSDIWKTSCLIMCCVCVSQVILDLKGSDFNYTYQTPPASPSNTLSRKSSISR